MQYPRKAPTSLTSLSKSSTRTHSLASLCWWWLFSLLITLRTVGKYYGFGEVLVGGVEDELGDD